MTELGPHIGATAAYVGANTSHNRSSDFLPPIQLEGPIHSAVNATSIIILLATMLSLGCAMEISKVKRHVQRPVEVAIGLLTQFGIMPLAAFCLGKALKLEPVKAMAVLICGCCPGGTLSNLFAFAIGGDVNLSITMTTCSSIVGLGVMPLLLFLYCQGLPNLGDVVPYTSIIITLVIGLVPCIIGISINHYRPKYTPIVQRTGLIILLISVVITSILTGIMVRSSILLVFTPELITVSVLLPLIGYSLGYAVSYMCRVGSKCSRTIAMETGCQNVQMCVAILKVAFPMHVIGTMFLFPLIYIIGQCSVALALIVGYRYYHKIKPSAEELTVSVDVTQEEMKTGGGKSSNAEDRKARNHKAAQPRAEF